MTVSLHAVMFPLYEFTDYGLVFLRIMAGLVFSGSGFADLKDPESRGKSIEMSKSFTMSLGWAELLGGPP